MNSDLIHKAIAIAGSQSALARRCGKKQGHVSYWLNSDRVSPEAALLIDAATEGAVSRHDLRPDIFGPPPPSPTTTVESPSPQIHADEGHEDVRR